MLDLTAGDPSDGLPVMLPEIPPLRLGSGVAAIDEMTADLLESAETLANSELLPQATYDAVLAQARDARTTRRLTWVLVILTLAVLAVTLAR